MKIVTTETFILRSRKIHENFYDYSLVEYIHSHTPVKIICKYHGVFDQMPRIHLQNHGCPKCGIVRIQRKRCYERHGVSHVSRVPEINERKKRTMMERYGCSAPYGFKKPGFASHPAKLIQVALKYKGIDYPEVVRKKTLSEETLRKMSEIKKGKPVSGLSRWRMSESRKRYFREKAKEEKPDE